MQKEYKRRWKARQYIQDTHPGPNEKCEDRFVTYTLHFDGVSTSFYGNSKSFEVVSLQIVNTPETNRLDGRFCCFVAVFKHIEKVPTAQQPYIGAFHVIVKTIVLNGILGRYYYYRGVWLHVRWMVIALCGDTKAQDVMAGFPGKQMSEDLTIHSDLKRVSLDPITGMYNPLGNYPTAYGSKMTGPDSMWNLLHPSSYVRFWNAIASGDSKKIDYLRQKADPAGVKEIDCMLLLKQKTTGDRGWKPVPLTEDIRAAVNCNLLLEALKENEESGIAKFPKLKTALRFIKQTDHSTADPLPHAGTLRGILSEQSEKDLQSLKANNAQYWYDLVSSVEDSVAKEALADFISYYLKKQEPKEVDPDILPLENHLPVLPGFAFAMDVMHLVGNVMAKFQDLLQSELTTSQADLQHAGFDSYVSSIVGSPMPSIYSVDPCFLNRARQRLSSYIARHPGYFSQIDTSALFSNSMTGVKMVARFHLVFGLAHFAFQDFWNESPILEMLAVYDGLSYFSNVTRDINEAADVQARMNFFMGKLCNSQYPGFANPSLVHTGSLFDSLIKVGPLWNVASFKAEGSYHFVVVNYNPGRSPYKTLFDRLHVMMVAKMGLYWNSIKEDVVESESSWTFAPGTSGLLHCCPEWISDMRIAVWNLCDDFNYFDDDSVVHDDLFYAMLEQNALPDGTAEKYKGRSEEFHCSGQSKLLSHLTWNGCTYHSALEETTGVNKRKALHSISLKNLEYSKDCLGITVDRKGGIVVMLVVGYYVTTINGKPFPEAVGIVLPTVSFSMVSPWCHHCFLDTKKDILGVDKSYQCVRVSLNRVHIDTAIPFPYNNKNLMFYTGCLVLRPELAIHASDMFFPKFMSRTDVIPRRSERKPTRKEKE